MAILTACLNFSIILSVFTKVMHFNLSWNLLSGIAGSSVMQRDFWSLINSSLQINVHDLVKCALEIKGLIDRMLLFIISLSWLT